jgi:hypothetical protein
MYVPLLLFKHQRDILVLPLHSATVTHRRSLWPVKFALEALDGTVAWQVGIPDLSRGVRSGDLGGQSRSSRLAKPQVALYRLHLKRHSAFMALECHSQHACYNQCCQRKHNESLAVFNLFLVYI